MEFLSAVGIGLFTSWLPGVVIWLLVTFGVPQILIYAAEKIDPKNKHNKALEQFCIWWTGLLLFIPPAVVVYLIFRGQ